MCNSCNNWHYFQAVVEVEVEVEVEVKNKKSVDSFHISFLEKSFGSVSGRVC